MQNICMEVSLCTLGMSLGFSANAALSNSKGNYLYIVNHWHGARSLNLWRSIAQDRLMAQVSCTRDLPCPYF